MKTSGAARRVDLGNTHVTFYPKLTLVVDNKKVELVNSSSEQKAFLQQVVSAGSVMEIEAPTYREGAADFMEAQARRLRSGEVESARAQWRDGTNFLEVVEVTRAADGSGTARYFLVVIRTPTT